MRAAQRVTRVGLLGSVDSLSTFLGLRLPSAFAK